MGPPVHPIVAIVCSSALLFWAMPAEALTHLEPKIREGQLQSGVCNERPFAQPNPLPSACLRTAMQSDLILVHWDAGGAVSVYRPNCSNADRLQYLSVGAHGEYLDQDDARVEMGNLTQFKLMIQAHVTPELGSRARNVDALWYMSDLVATVPCTCDGFPIMMFTVNRSCGCQKLMPSLYEIGGFARLYAQKAREAAGMLGLSARPATVFWRGCTQTFRPWHQQGLDPRTHLVALAKSFPWVDAADVCITPGKHVPIEQYAHSGKYLIDIGGTSGTTWGAFHWKLASRALVMRVWHDDMDDWFVKQAGLQPYKHYVPIKADFSDLHEIFQWLEANPQTAQDMADAGAAAVRAFDDDKNIEGSTMVQSTRQAIVDGFSLPGALSESCHEPSSNGWVPA